MYFKDIYRHNKIINIYQKYLKRKPSEQELQKMFYSDKSLKHIFQYVCLTDEYFEKNGISYISKYFEWPWCQYFKVKKENLIYIPIAKNACTTFKSVFYNVNKSIMPNEYKDIEIKKGHIHEFTDLYQTYNLIGDYSPYENIQIERNDPTYLIILREPVERIISAFWDKFCKSYNCEYTKRFITNDIIKHLGKSGININEGITFKEFIHFLSSTNIKTLNAHFKPQHLYFNDNIKTKFYKLEQTDILLDEINSIFSLNIPPKRLNSFKNSKNDYIKDIFDIKSKHLNKLKDRPSYESFLDEDINSLIRDIYKKDFNYFNKL